MPVSRRALDRVVEAVQRSGADRLMDDILRSGVGGRPRATRMDVYIALVVLTAMNGKGLSFENIHQFATQELADSAQRSYGIRTGNGLTSRVWTVRQVRYPLEALCKKLGAGSDGDQLQVLLDKIVGSSLPDHLPQLQTVALDATGVASWAKGTASNAQISEAVDAGAADLDGVARGVGRCSFDPDARWGYRTKTYHNGTSSVFGYNMVSIVGVPAVGADKDSIPILTQAIRVLPANSSVIAPGLALIDQYKANGPNFKEVINDRAWSYAKPEEWVQQLRARDVEQVLDLHPNDHGVRDYEGVRMVDGTPHCPALPDRLVRIERPPRFQVSALPKNASFQRRRQHEQDRQKLEQFRALIAERRTWAFRRVAGPNAAGTERWECPAQATRRACVNCPFSLTTGEDLPRVANPPTGSDKPKCCSQRTITIKADVSPKTRQRHYWGSPEWIASFNRRTYVEGSYGNLKNPSTENVTRGWCRVVGLVKTSFMLAAAVAASNIRLLRRWAARTGDMTAPISVTEAVHYRWEEVDCDGHIVTHDPPPDRPV